MELTSGVRSGGFFFSACRARGSTGEFMAAAAVSSPPDDAFALGGAIAPPPPPLAPGLRAPANKPFATPAPGLSPRATGRMEARAGAEGVGVRMRGKPGRAGERPRGRGFSVTQAPGRGREAASESSSRRFEVAAE